MTITMVKDTLDAVHTNESEIAVHWDVVEQIRITVQGKEKVAFWEGPEDLKQFGTQE